MTGNRLTYLSLLVVLLSSFTPNFSWAQEAELISRHGAWSAYSFKENGNLVCYIASEPINAEGNYTRRGDIFALITHRPAKNSKNVFSYVAGYPYKSNSDVIVDVDNQTFTLVAQGEMAWASDKETDNRLAKAVQQGSRMVVKGRSSRGTLTTDTYSLRGSAAAHNAISKKCNVN